MITKIDQETKDFLSKKKLTFNQFCMCLMILHDDVTGIIQYTEEVGFISGGEIVRPDNTKVNEFEDLVNRKFIKYTQVDLKDRYSLANYTITDKFLKGFTNNLKEAAKEFFEAYPVHIWINGAGGGQVPAKAIDYEEFEEKYIKHIEGDFSVHNKIMAKVKQMKTVKEYAPMTIVKFFSSRYYESIQDASEQSRSRSY